MKSTEVNQAQRGQNAHASLSFAQASAHCSYTTMLDAQHDVLHEMGGLLLTLNNEVYALTAQSDKLAEAARAVEPHPNATAYANGGVLAAKGFGARHVLPFIGLTSLAWQAVLSRIEAVQALEPDCTLTCIRKVCEQDATLEALGLAWCEGNGLLRSGQVPAKWRARPKLGLGQPAKFHGLTRDDASAHRAIFALGFNAMHEAFARASGGSTISFSAMLPIVIAQGGKALHDLGVAAVHGDAAARYRRRSRSFAAHQAATDNRDWRLKPPLSRQGHLAITTARQLHVELPAERTRGGAADWLDAHGANLRFRGEER